MAWIGPEYVQFGRWLKIALVGDARVGKSSWLSKHLWGCFGSEYTPTIGCNPEEFNFDVIEPCLSDFKHFKTVIWDISGSHSTAQDRAKWMEECDAAIIMVDLADRASIENTASWYREIMSSQKQNSLPVVICCFKEPEESDQRAIDPAEISWPDELGNTPFFYYKPRNLDAMDINREINRPIGWILEQLTGKTGAYFHFIPPLDSSNYNTAEGWPNGTPPEIAAAALLPIEDDDEDL